MSVVIHIPLHLLLFNSPFIHLFSSHSSPSGTDTCLTSLHRQYFLPPFMCFYLIHRCISVLLFTCTKLHQPNTFSSLKWIIRWTVLTGGWAKILWWTTFSFSKKAHKKHFYSTVLSYPQHPASYLLLVPPSILQPNIQAVGCCCPLWREATDAALHET